MSKSAYSERLQHVVTFFEALDRVALARIDTVYANDVWFKDPFNQVKGITAVTHIFEHMFVQVDEPRFVIIEVVEQGDAAFLTWDFRFRMKRFDTKTLQTVRGASHLKFASDGRINFHRDYWDAAEELYEKLPLLGSLMRWLKRQAG